MMGRRDKLKGGDEWDAITARQFYKYLQRSRVCKRIKQRLNRRNRRKRYDYTTDI
jgi:hypothetical protein